MKINLDFDLVDSKIITKVYLKPPGYTKPKPMAAIFDPGNNMTMMSDVIFNLLKYPIKDSGIVNISSANGTSKGTSTVIDYFEFGGSKKRIGLYLKILQQGFFCWRLNWAINRDTARKMIHLTSRYLAIFITCSPCCCA